MACKHQYYDFGQILCWKDKKNARMRSRMKKLQKGSEGQM